MSSEPVADAAADRPADVLLEATGIVAGYVPEVNILNGLDLTLQRGEFVGIIGPNGAGKSTFLKAVLGLVPVRVRHRAVRGRRHHRPPAPTSSSRRASGTCPRPATCSPASR